MHHVAVSRLHFHQIAHDAITYHLQDLFQHFLQIDALKRRMAFDLGHLHAHLQRQLHQSHGQIHTNLITCARIHNNP